MYHAVKRVYHAVKKKLYKVIKKTYTVIKKRAGKLLQRVNKKINEYKSFVRKHQTELIEDSILGTGIVLSYAGLASTIPAPIATGAATTAASVPLMGTITMGAGVFLMISEGELSSHIRNRYTPKKYWKNFSYHPNGIWTVTYTAYNTKTHYCDSFEVNKKPDESPDWNGQIIYISGTNGGSKITLNQLRKLNKNLSWGYSKCPIPK